MLHTDWLDVLSKHDSNSALVVTHKDGTKNYAEYIIQEVYESDVLVDIIHLGWPIRDNSISVVSAGEDGFNKMLWNLDDIVEVHAQIFYPKLDPNTLSTDGLDITPVNDNTNLYTDEIQLYP